MVLYSFAGGEPAPLLFGEMFAADGKLWTDIPNSPEAQAALDIVPAPDKPAAAAGTEVVWANRAWSVQPLAAPDLASLKAAALAELQARKAAALAAMTYLDYRVTLSVQDQLDVQQQLALLAAEPAGTEIRWEIVGNTFLTWTAADLQALQAAGVAHVKAVYANTDRLAGLVAEAADASAIPDVTAGWPA